MSGVAGSRDVRVGLNAWLPATSPPDTAFYGLSREYTREEFMMRIRSLGGRPPWWRFIARRRHDEMVRRELWWFLNSFSVAIPVEGRA